MIHYLKADKIELRADPDGLLIISNTTGQRLLLTSGEWRELAYLIQILSATSEKPS
jgi:hypothetical protein